MAYFNNTPFISGTNTDEYIKMYESKIYDIDNDGLFNIIIENYEDNTEIIKAMHSADIAELEMKHQSVTESSDYTELSITMENKLENIIDKISEVVYKLGQKIKIFFDSVKSKLITATQDNKKFYNKYYPILTSDKVKNKYKDPVGPSILMGLTPYQGFMYKTDGDTRVLLPAGIEEFYVWFQGVVKSSYDYSKKMLSDVQTKMKEIENNMGGMVYKEYDAEPKNTNSNNNTRRTPIGLGVREESFHLRNPYYSVTEADGDSEKKDKSNKQFQEKLKEIRKKYIETICKPFDINPDKINDVNTLYTTLTNYFKYGSVDGIIDNMANQRIYATSYNSVCDHLRNLPNKDIKKFYESQKNITANFNEIHKVINNTRKIVKSKASQDVKKDMIKNLSLCMKFMNEQKSMALVTIRVAINVITNYMMLVRRMTQLAIRGNGENIG